MPSYPKSDHYDGSRFFNPTNPKGNGLVEVVKMLSTMRYESWPKSVANSPAPDLNQKLAEDEVAITFINHATVLVQTPGFTFLTDPVWAERVSPVPFAGPKRHREPGLRLDQLPKIDLVLVSHNHYDHMDLATLKKLNEMFQPQFVVPLGNREPLLALGLLRVDELDWWQSFSFSAGSGSDAEVTLAPAEHFSGRSPFDRDQTLWGSFNVSYGGHSIYFGGDSAYSPHFKAIRERIGRPSIAFLPIGAYDPRWFMKVVHMNPDEAALAHIDLEARKSIGIHFGTFQLTSELIDQPVKDLALALESRGISPDDFVTLPEGRTRVFRLLKS